MDSRNGVTAGAGARLFPGRHNRRERQRYGRHKPWDGLQPAGTCSVRRAMRLLQLRLLEVSGCIGDIPEPPRGILLQATPQHSQ